jgi:hypothetical protein
MKLTFPSVLQIYEYFLVLQVFNVHLNGVAVISELDIFAQVGRGVAHQELIAFTISNSRYITLRDGTKTPLATHSSVRLDFMKVTANLKYGLRKLT